MSNEQPMMNAKEFDSLVRPYLDEIRKNPNNKEPKNILATLVLAQAEAIVAKVSRNPGDNVVTDSEQIATDATVNFLKAAKNTEIDYPSSYLFKSVKNQFLLELGKRHGQINLSALAGSSVNYDAPDHHVYSPELARALLYAEQHHGIPEEVEACLKVAISQLSDRAQGLATIYYIERPAKKIIELAMERFDIPEGTAKRAMLTMRSDLHKILQKMATESSVNGGNSETINETIDYLNRIETSYWDKNKTAPIKQ